MAAAKRMGGWGAVVEASSSRWAVRRCRQTGPETPSLLPRRTGGELCSVHGAERRYPGRVCGLFSKGASSPVLLGLPELCETRRICHYKQSRFLPFMTELTALVSSVISFITLNFY